MSGPLERIAVAAGRALFAVVVAVALNVICAMGAYLIGPAPANPYRHVTQVTPPTPRETRP